MGGVVEEAGKGAESAIARSSNSQTLAWSSSVRVYCGSKVSSPL